MPDNWKSSSVYMLSLTGMLWAIEVINSSLDHSLNIFGIYPRTLDGLPGVVFWPFLHGNIQHLMVNTTPFLVLGWFVALRGAKTFIQTSLLILLIAGLGVWLFGRSSYHLGVSGMVFGYFGFLVARGIYERSMAALFIASLTLFYYGGFIVGILPAGGRISWETHLFGLIAGIFAARQIPLPNRETM